ncbi:LemA family protein [Lysinibacillus odysseyi 34hs-1 = NBRC 100172]|uniref:LemA family protein n=2 Tax=Lysinibacillus odysseyi TaxID=202611 RepID=A0A0A3J6Z2_9BACI|nr:LemA family protein [Lysinibacillus odysseyi 34hs-1 = NBRC 100172]
MSSAMVIIIAIIVLIGIALLLIVPKYNSLVNGEEQIEASWSQVENQLQRRFDLIPNLVQTVKGYAAHEEEVFTQIADARTRYGGAATVDEAAQANNELTSALSRLLVVVENYPQLKADVQFTQLMDELSGTENRLTVARQDYNEEVKAFNSDVRSFPGNLIAGMFGFEKKEYFEASNGAEKAPSVNFDTDE